MKKTIAMLMIAVLLLGASAACASAADFRSPMEQVGAWEADKEYTDYGWWLARTADGGWDVLTWGYG